MHGVGNIPLFITVLITNASNHDDPDHSLIALFPYKKFVLYSLILHLRSSIVARTNYREPFTPAQSFLFQTDNPAINRTKFLEFGFEINALRYF